MPIALRKSGIGPSCAVVDPDIEACECIFDPGVTLVVLQRQRDPQLAGYLAAVAPRLPVGEQRHRLRAAAPSVDAVLRNWPLAPGKEVLAQDCLWLLDLFTTLADAETIGLRLGVTRVATCPRFHTDQVGLRLICTWQGPATQWLEHEGVDRRRLGAGARGLSDEDSGLLLPGSVIHALEPFDVGILKGEKWPGNAGRGHVHRSPDPLGALRVMITLDALA